MPVFDCLADFAVYWLAVSFTQSVVCKPGVAVAAVTAWLPELFRPSFVGQYRFVCLQGASDGGDAGL